MTAQSIIKPDYKLAFVHVSCALEAVNGMFCQILEKEVKAIRARQVRMAAARARKNPDPPKKENTPDLSLVHNIERLEAISELSITASEISDAERVGESLARYLRFLDRYSDQGQIRSTDIAGNTAAAAVYECKPLVERLKSLVHILRAHPEDAIKRADKVVNEAARWSW